MHVPLTVCMYVCMYSLLQPLTQSDCWQHIIMWVFCPEACTLVSWFSPQFFPFLTCIITILLSTDIIMWENNEMQAVIVQWYVD